MKKDIKGMKKDSPKLEKLEEKEHKDLDHDGEKGEPLAHRIKVLGKKKAEEKKPNAKLSKKDDKKSAKKDDKKDNKKPVKAKGK